MERGLQEFGEEMKETLRKANPRGLEEYMATGGGSRLPDREMNLTPEEEEEKRQLKEKYASLVIFCFCFCFFF